MKSKFLLFTVTVSLFWVSACNYQKEVPNDPLVQLFVINFANEYYSNSCKFPKLTLRKDADQILELKQNEKQWFRFSFEDYKSLGSNPPNLYLKISKQAGTEVSFYTNNNCGQYSDSSYQRLPISSTSTDVIYGLYKSDFQSYETVKASENGYYIDYIFGNPTITIRQY
ncbi:hypothetical protein [Leptospira brenneri]|uniref:Lipoprotein n=1 Tax=Leptospira brenneri TaxID=2023182 RepID=A0A2M9Y4C4_9LEPT|nr:hypothetical protein [Leptospira brenneri]PJZ46415.1 hypothetical protein CH361_04810 [Leptospira brenneri]TGK96517.1 hypothetical protein EHQ30_07930 [Leptospira brenneri]